ncbi:mitochondrial Complex I (CI) NADH:ubiquinone oxidoreductase subunit B18/NB8M/NDUFB7 [Andalucia godoyi]|uniref:NADH dehydrogenase [ubiquinone] 1 beta subcomplex subunit 7 n=1 Tax=Andalucia godoyi TaxID=505711 RepID=A0A8K0AHS3_ANDGO|nr:mitochondrial Complex I (CI) NADH:ubiquinone oxidoreductase subunit B18/NB8M/NDUFB7 [Andalucia godoyi]|eukprot:ANDGO_01668.mRNA.1 mitochondrial Complex I (CI) NADH:ubiquinone oxidoreductase subunit B18/NB8M/NDUFB7
MTTGASSAELSAARVDPAFRDGCAGLLIALNKCRRETFHLGGRSTCHDLLHEYEACQYQDHERRKQIAIQQSAKH